MGAKESTSTLRVRSHSKFNNQISGASMVLYFNYNHILQKLCHRGRKH